MAHTFDIFISCSFLALNLIFSFHSFKFFGL